MNICRTVLKKRHSDFASSSSLHINPEDKSDNNNLQSTFNDSPTSEYDIPLVSIDDRFQAHSVRGTNAFEELAKLARNKSSTCNDFLWVQVRNLL